MCVTRRHWGVTNNAMRLEGDGSITRRLWDEAGITIRLVSNLKRAEESTTRGAGAKMNISKTLEGLSNMTRGSECMMNMTRGPECMVSSASRLASNASVTRKLGTDRSITRKLWGVAQHTRRPGGVSRVVRRPEHGGTPPWRPGL